MAKGATARGARRRDFGRPIGGFIEGRPAEQRALLKALRRMVEEAAPGVQASLKWGMPFFCYGKRMMCALTAHKAHVNLVLVGPPHEFVDPKRRLSGAGKGSRTLRLTSLDDLPRADVKRWLRVAAKHAKIE